MKKARGLSETGSTDKLLSVSHLTAVLAARCLPSCKDVPTLQADVPCQFLLCKGLKTAHLLTHPNHSRLQGFWSRVQWLWDSPPIKRVRITMTMAQWSVRIPAIIALLATQGSLLASSVRPAWCILDRTACTALVDVHCPHDQAVVCLDSEERLTHSARSLRWAVNARLDLQQMPQLSLQAASPTMRQCRSCCPELTRLCCAVLPAHAGSPAHRYRHPAEEHPGERQLSVPTHWAHGHAHLGSLVREPSGRQLCCLPAPPGLFSVE